MANMEAFGGLGVVETPRWAALGKMATEVLATQATVSTENTMSKLSGPDVLILSDGDGVGLKNPDLTSDLSVHDLPLDVDADLDNAEFARIMRRIGIADGEPGTPVSAFNSSI